MQSFQNNYNKQAFSAIVQHCQKHVNVLAKIYVPYWSQADPNFILTGLHFLCTLRAGVFPVEKFAQSISVPCHPDSLSMQTQIPGNIRMFPNEERFCQRIFKRSCRQNPAVKLPTGEADLAMLMKYVQAWFEQGL
jgi:hypothetical protein